MDKSNGSSRVNISVAAVLRQGGLGVNGHRPSTDSHNSGHFGFLSLRSSLTALQLKSRPLPPSGKLVRKDSERPPKAAAVLPQNRL